MAMFPSTKIISAPDRCPGVPRTARERYASAGIGLVEVLVTLAVTSVVVAGAMGLQKSAVETVAKVRYHQQAQWLARTMAEYVRANPVAAQANLYALNPSDPLDAAPACDTQICAPDALAVYHKHRWLGLVQQTLPHSTATIRRLDDGHVIELRWRPDVGPCPGPAGCAETVLTVRADGTDHG